MHTSRPAFPRAAAAAVLLVLVAAGCGPTVAVGEEAQPAAAGPSPPAVAASDPVSPTATPGPAVGTSAAAPPAPSPAAPTPSGAPPTTAPAAPSPAPPTPGPAAAGSPAPSPRQVAENAWTPFATVGGVVLHHPSARVELVGFHESNHDGARQLEALDSAVPAMTLESRERGTGSRTAADVVVDPQLRIRAPVTGTVVRAGTYVLYCDHRDDYAVIEPDDHPGWEVKVLHIDGVRVRAGARVEAGVTVLAAGPTPLPFRSQVDDHTAEPSWPHVHIEVVDPSIPDRPSPGGGC